MRDSLNIKEISDTGPDYLGFIFYSRSKRYIGKDPDPNLFRQVRKGILKVGVFVDEEEHTVLEIAGRYALDLVQLHGSEPPHYCQRVRSHRIRVIKAFGMEDDFDFNRLEPYMDSCDYFLFDTKSVHHGGTGMKFNWNLIANYQLQVPFFLSGGLGPEDIPAINTFRHPALHAVDINSRFETEPGIKNTEQIREFIKDLNEFNQ